MEEETGIRRLASFSQSKISRRKNRIKINWSTGLCIIHELIPSNFYPSMKHSSAFHYCIKRLAHKSILIFYALTATKLPSTLTMTFPYYIHDLYMPACDSTFVILNQNLHEIYTCAQIEWIVTSGLLVMEAVHGKWKWNTNWKHTYTSRAQLWCILQRTPRQTWNAFLSSLPSTVVLLKVFMLALRGFKKNK